jgi:HlyD family secretion protein
MTATSELERSASENGASALDRRVRSLRLAEQPTSSPRTALLPWAMCAILLLTTTAFGYRAYRVGALAPSPVADTPAESKSAPSSTPRAATASEGEVVVRARGYVVPAHQVQVSPKVGGMIVSLNERFEKYGEGQFFNKGDELARLEETDYKAEYDHAVAARDAAKQRYEETKTNPPEEIESARNELKESEATLRQLELELRRTERLVGTDALSAKDYEQARFAHDAMKRRAERLRFALKIMTRGAREERRNAAEADLKAAEADVIKAKWRWDNCVIRAPISGHILTKKAEKGNVVNPLAFSIAASLCEMADLGDLEIDLSIQERDIAQIEKGQLCTVMPEAFQNHEPFRKLHPHGYDGHVSRLMPIADRSKGAINVRVKVQIPKDEVGKILKPEMSVVVLFQKTAQH